jgi:preprotein translocase subunit SecB
MAEPVQPLFNIEKLYVKDMSLEVPSAPRIYLERETPQVEVAMNNEAKVIDEGFYDVTLTVTVTAKVGERTVFLVEATQAGVFQIRNIPEQEMEQVLAITCPNILYPYVRQVVSDTVVRAGFPPVMLNPMNFEAVYQARQQHAAQATAPTTTH